MTEARFGGAKYDPKVRKSYFRFLYVEFASHQATEILPIKIDSR